MKNNSQKIRKIWTDTFDPFFERVLSFCLPGKHCKYILNIKNMEYEWMSNDIEAMLGYSRNEINTSLLLSLIHPQDQPILSIIENKIRALSEATGADRLICYKVCYDFRIKNKNGHYIRILNQLIQMKEDNNIYKRLGIYIDISHIKKNGEPSLSLININGEDSFIDIPLDMDYLDTCPFTKREKEIAFLIIQGYTNKEIADTLYIFVDTVKNHKKHIFTKSKCYSSLQLAQMCTVLGWTKHFTFKLKK